MKLAKTVAGISLLTLVLAGCDDSPSSQYLDNTHPSGTSAMSVQQQFGQLMQRPSLEETTSHYEQMRQKIADMLTQKFGVTDWGKRDSPATSTGCGSSYSVDDYDARAFVAQIWYSKTPVTYAQWPQAKSLVSEIASSYGFSAVALVIDKSDDMDLELNDSYGGKLTFGSAVNTSLSFRTGCHLTDEAKKRGTPRPTS
jgi:predicted LppA-like lipoprotein